VNSGKEYRLVTTDDDWLVDHSPYSQVDLEADPKPGPPEPDKLDYALLLVDGGPGDEVLLQVPGEEPTKRGWLEVSEAIHPFETGTPLFIVQHPKGNPLKLAFDTDAVIGVFGDGQRVRYKTNTEPGSSGSPVFDENWNLVALHHSGDPEGRLPPQYNEGIPMSAILALLKQRQVDSYLGHQEL
jgi:hypothetical protein